MKYITIKFIKHSIEDDFDVIEDLNEYISDLYDDQEISQLAVEVSDDEE